ncbi:MAG: conserved rane protein of unknown function [Candidatus Saccharibacteria bacterium]|nr:conserved rane protein of unknown function [Candidatus Saccharibacteria bacterium]
MGIMHRNHPLRIFGVSGLLTLVLGIWVAWVGGIEALWIYLILVILEITFSFDNAIVNSRILMRLSRYWQALFLTVGIFFAVFVVRFLLPVLIVVVATKLNFIEVIGLALRAPALYAAELHHAEPLINAFGGTFLVMIGLSYFVDSEKDVHWLTHVEKALARVGNVRYIKLAVVLLATLVISLTVDPGLRDLVLWSSIFGIVLHVGLDGISTLFGDGNSKKKSKKPTQLVGMAAFAMFAYLQVLDASFSFDGVIGAFAITSGVLLIMAGLGAGAVWVRSLTVYLVRTGTLAKYRYLEHGAHWAILALGALMLAKLYHLELPEWATGSLGLVFIVAAVTTSVLEKRSKK